MKGNHGTIHYRKREISLEFEIYFDVTAGLQRVPVPRGNFDNNFRD